MHRSFIRYFSALAAALGIFCIAAPAASAAPAEVNRTEFFRVEFNSCNGDNVQNEGPLHVVTKTQTDGSTMIHVEYHATGVGQPSGLRYMVNLNETATSSNTGSSDAEFERVISTGGDENQLFTLTFKNGALTITSKCAG